jgi:hypothetical protein
MTSKPVAFLLADLGAPCADTGCCTWSARGNKPATMPLTVPVLRVLEACRGQRTSGPLVLRPISGQPINPTRLPRHTAIDLVLRSRSSEHCPDPPDECVPPRLVLRQTYK